MLEGVQGVLPFQLSSLGKGEGEIEGKFRISKKPSLMLLFLEPSRIRDPHYPIYQESPNGRVSRRVAVGMVDGAAGRGGAVIFNSRGGCEKKSQDCVLDFRGIVLIGKDEETDS